MPKMNKIESQILDKQIDNLEIYLNLNDSDDDYFSKIIGNIEDIIIDENFLNLLNVFMDKYLDEFDDKDENKLIYTDIFKEYLETIEKYIETRLINLIDNFKMSEFEDELKKRKTGLDGQIFEILETFSDFESFKSMVLDYKYMKMGKSLDLSKDITVKKYIVKNELNDENLMH